MKIRPISQFGYTVVHETREPHLSEQSRSQADGGSSGGYQHTHEDLKKAVQEFQEDEQTKINGLEISMTPGLTVVLKDRTGAFIREFSGEEFLKLKHDALHVPGKILDQKA